ncbi:MAG: peptidoglycan-N-acetylglucosamine deacetylase [Solirubrobacteraceae bacterium]|jgi:peptidoglycan/xylan/chitin deacetylase (PgdA/CDA1 family)|nr:peptidoglycan-N-acetylglucosamine deacetylase [Solirubrobacteraceae bacterium]
MQARPPEGAEDTEAQRSDERRARRDAQALAHRRARLVALGALVAIVAIVALSLDQSAPAGAPLAPATPSRQSAPGASRAAADDKAIDDVLAYTPYVVRGRHRRKEVALTFDDGPGPSTPALLRYLKANHVPATFFLVGRAIAEHPDLVRRESRAGFSLGTHTENHARLGSRTVADQSQEILTAADRITQISGHAVRLFRPPYGSFDANTLGVLRAERMLMALWSIDTRDYAATSPGPIVRAALSAPAAGAVVLMHDGPAPRPNTLAALHAIVPTLRRRGYRLVSLPALLRDDPPPRHQPAPHNLAG